MSTKRRIKGLKTKLTSLTVSFNLIKTFVNNYQEERDAFEIPATTSYAKFGKPKAFVSASVTGPSSHASTGQARKGVLLATAVVKLVDDNGTEHVARALLGSGSECCFITESLLQVIKSQRTKISVPISGIGQSSTYARYKIVASIQSRVCDYSTSAEFLVLPKVTIDLPSVQVDSSSWTIPPGVQLADPLFYELNPVDIIIGAAVFFELLKVSGHIQHGESRPTLVHSVLGWIVSGKTSHGTPKSPIIVNVATITDLHKLIEKFWSIEEDESTPNHSVGDNRSTAVRRFRMLQGRLFRNPGIAQQYRYFMDKYLALGHMKQVFDYQSPPSPCYHMPHHAVVREESTTTKLRVVFDASCKTPEGPSLNDALMVGPTVQQEIRSIIMRSRIRRTMVIADAKQMYR
ncbi:uncharacterized protein LOC135710198 [Ochlerotatus camptorhynchus]|uniref:uncharacterized protein LOC135710198 n=1 Tax=Ochlerotatus camptorhynchus TaxID=644619 RepID=UPI0031E2B3B4